MTATTSANDRLNTNKFDDELPTRMTPGLLWKLGRFGEAAVSPDGKQVAFTVRRYELAKNVGRTTLYLLNLGDDSQSTLLVDWSAISCLQWRSVGAANDLFFLGVPPSSDEVSDKEPKPPAPPKPQAYRIDPNGSAAVQLTHLKDGIANLKLSPADDKIAFTSSVKLDPKPVEIYPDLPLADARIIDGLMYRHWNRWHDYTYSHLHVMAHGDDENSSEPIDLMKGIRAHCPLPPQGDAEDFNWSPDGNELAFTMKCVPDPAQSTNSDIYLVDADGGSEPRNVSAPNQGYDRQPVFSPDGKFLIYHSMVTASFEADRNRIMLVSRETGESVDLTKGLDQSAHGTKWLLDSSGFVFVSEVTGCEHVYQIDLTGELKQLTEGPVNWGLVDRMPDGKSLLLTKTSMVRPAELYLLSLEDGQTKLLTHINDEIFENLQLPTVQERWTTATDGKSIHSWVIYPPDFDPESNQQWPLLTFCQGGPQSQVGQNFSYRWNFNLMASQGFVIVAPNRRGLPGFGQQWNNQISGDWGGQAMQDLLSATDDMIDQPYIDAQRVGAVGASFGGYSVYWLMGNHENRFSAMISHCGVFNLESMYAATEELHFVNHDLGGPYWKSPEVSAKYQEFSPHRFVANWQTPLLVIHGEKDYRVPINQGIEAFTVAQVQNCPSRFLYFPEEGHWVESPQNSVLWQRVFFDWLKQHLGSEANGA